MAVKTWQLWAALALVGMAALPTTAQQAHRLPPAPVLIAAPEAEQAIGLRSVRVEGEVQAGVAQTRIELEFHNPNRRVLEGELQFPLADGQQLTGFALDIDGQMRDAVPVPKERGRQVFEAITRQNVDPGLLEQTAGNQFRLRIYPLPAGGTRRVRLTLREAMPISGEAWQWRMPLQFAAEAGQVSLKLHAPVTPQGGEGAFAFRGRELSWQGSGRQLPPQLEWRLPAQVAAGMQVASFEGEHYLLAQLPVPKPAQRALPAHVGLLWDASGSAVKRDRAAEFALLDRYFEKLGNGSVALTVLRDTATPVRRFNIRNGDWSALRRVLEQEPLDGASALSSWKPDPAIKEYLLLSDGLGNWGNERMPVLSADQQLFAISSAGAHADSVRLRGWSEANRGRLVMLDGGNVATAMTELLAEPLAVEVAQAAGLDDVVIDRRSINQGWLWIHARAQNAGVPLRVRIGNGPWQTPSLDATRADGALLAGLWAQARLQQLAVAPRVNREAMQRLSQRFGMVSEGTSLIVLDSIEDYLRYAIRPPAPLRAEYDKRYARELGDRDVARKQHLDDVASLWQERRQWWEKRWPKDAPAVKLDPRDQALQYSQNAGEARMRAAAPAPRPALGPPRPSPLPAPPAAAAEALDSVEVAAADAAGDAGEAVNEGQLQIRIAAWEPDSDVAKRLRKVPANELYAAYLRERAANAGSSAFYLDVADMLLAAGQRELALRVLSNLAEMDLDNRHLLRVLGYRLMQADAPELAVPVFEQVLVMAEDEPQSFRDLGLALAATGRNQEAVKALYEVVVREWDGRFDGVSLIALDELTNLIARAKPALDVQAIDPRLRHAMPLDLRVVLAWDSDNSDMDLWVTDPNGEKTYYGNTLSYQGGEISEDFIGGYGPEQFSLRDAKPGVYKVEANFYGSRQQLVTGATTLMLRLNTKWGTAAQQDKAVSMRLVDARDTVLVGEFEVR